MKIEIQTVHFNADQRLLDFVDRKVSKLTLFSDRIIDANVVLSMEKMGSQIKNKVAVIKLNVPGNMLVAKETAKVFEESVDLAVDSLKKQLEKIKKKN